MSRSDREGRLPCEGAGLPPCGKTERVCQIGKIRMRFALRCTCSRVCPLSHLLRKCQLSQRESREAGANRTHAASGCLLRRPARVLLLPSRLAPRHLPQGGRLWFYAQSNLSLPLGEMSRSDREGLSLEAAIFSNKKALRGVLFLFSWTMYCRMFGWLRCRQCCRCFLCFPCFRCLRPHRSPWSVPNPRP